MLIRDPCGLKFYLISDHDVMLLPDFFALDVIYRFLNEIKMQEMLTILVGHGVAVSLSKLSEKL